MKKNKIYTIIILILFSFFFSTINVSAAKQIKGKWPNPSGTFGSESYKLNNGVNKKVSNFGIFTVDGEHAYCIEPGAKMDTTGYKNNNTVELASYSSLTTKQKELISYVLTYAYKDSDPSEYKKNKYIKMAASQGLIWEIVAGDRTSFSSLSPNKNSKTTSLYNVIHNSKNSSVKEIAQEYDTIIKSIQGSFINQIGSGKTVFKPQGEATEVVMVWNDTTKKYTLTINDTDLQYWKAAETQGSLSVKLNKNSIIISSAKSIDKSTSALVKISVNGKNSAGAVVYKDSSYQDIVSIHGITLDKFIKVYTPKFQMKIKKTATLDNKSLAGVKYNICNKKTCEKSSIITTVTTNASGEAIYTEIPNPGTYYVKEISTLKGYELDSKVYSVNVTSSNIAGSSSFGSISLKNNNKVFNLTKYTIDEDGMPTILDDGCGTDSYTGPEFEIKENGKNLYFVEKEEGIYDLSDESNKDATKTLKTCEGKFKVYTLPNCNYTITEVKAPEGLTLPSNPTKSVNVCGSDKNVEFTNGFTGLEFQKKDEDGNFVIGGKFTLQRKINNIYRDILLEEISEGYYEYASDSKEDDTTKYIFVTSSESEDKGKAFIKNLPPGEYRVVEKEAPEGYELIKDKDSTAIVTIKDSDKDDYYLVELINRKSNKSGSESFAELIVTITTGRKIPNYVLIISSLLVLLIIMVILRNKSRK